MSRRALVVGTGGHARVVLSLLFSQGAHEILGILDLEAPRPGEAIMGVPVVGASEELGRYEGDAELDLFLAIGSNGLRRHWWDVALNAGFTLPNLISPAARIDPSARMGAGNVVCPFAFVGPEARMGNDNLINTGAVVEHEVVIGDDCHVASHCTISGRVRLGDGCFAGAGSTVIDRLTIAPRTTIGAGATIVRSIGEAGGTYVGTPARPIRRSEGQRAP